eukprot:GHVN01053955.1.p1 GENE.GHVN01053955.1~~GHVN01053955.1.p1  ORF type:complete len:150 (+),score=17.11 GHVN01053955.1:330-779(+)
MVANPLFWVAAFKNAGANQLTFHWEAVGDTESALVVARRVKESGMDVGIAVKPATDVKQIFPLAYSGLISTVLVMTVEPGFGGQSFQATMMDKVSLLRAEFPKLNVQVDGGLNTETTKVAKASGANVIVAGTALLQAKDPREVVIKMKE